MFQTQKSEGFSSIGDSVGELQMVSSIKYILDQTPHLHKDQSDMKDIMTKNQQEQLSIVSLLKHETSVVSRSRLMMSLIPACR